MLGVSATDSARCPPSTTSRRWPISGLPPPVDRTSTAKAGWTAWTRSPPTLTGRDSSEFGDDRTLPQSCTAGPWLSRVPSDVTAALAGVTDARRWSYTDDQLLEAV